MQGPHIHGYLDHLITRAIYLAPPASSSRLAPRQPQPFSRDTGHGRRSTLFPIVYGRQRSGMKNGAFGTAHVAQPSIWEVPPSGV